MVGLRRPKKGTTKETERRPQPLVTPAQRILQQQWLQPANTQGTPRVRLPRGTDIVPVPMAAKRPKVTAGDSRATGHQGRGVSIENIRSYTVVPALLSPLSSNHDEEEIHVEEVAGEGEARAKMADPTPTEQAGANTAHASSTVDAPSTQGEASATLTIVADVHAPADKAHEQGGERQRDVEMATVGDAIQEPPQSLSQEVEDRRFAEMANWKRQTCERVARKRQNNVLIDQERETLLLRLRELDRIKEQNLRDIEKDENRLNRYKDLFDE